MKLQPTRLPAAPLEIETLDGKVYRGNSGDEIVDAMRADTNFALPEQTREEFREAFATRARLWIKQPVRHDTSSRLLLDLADIGLIVIRRAS